MGASPFLASIHKSKPLKIRELTLGGQGQGQQFLHSTLGLLSFGLSVRPHKGLGSQGGAGNN